MRFLVLLVRDTWSARCALPLALALLAPAALGASDSGEPLTGFHREWVWSTLGAWPGEGGFEVVDVDSDGRIDIVLATDTDYYYTEGRGRWLQLRLEDSFEQTWSSLTHAEDLRLLRTVETASGIDVVVADGDELFVHDGRSKVLLRTILTGATGMSALAVADLDAQGGLEALVCDSDALYAYDYETGLQLSVKYGFGCSDLALGQIDADPALEIALAGNAFGGILLDGGTLDVDWLYLPGFESRVRLSDADHDGLDEAVTLADGSRTLQVVDPQSGQVLWQVSNQYFGPIHAADLDGDGFEEILWGDESYGNVHVLEETTGVEILEIPHYSYDVMAISTGDPDEDGHVEILWTAEGSGYNAYRIFAWDVADAALEAESDAFSGPFPGVFAAQLDSDSGLELLTTCASSADTNGATGGRHLVFEVSTHALGFVSAPVPPDGYDPYVFDSLLAQLDGIGPQEVCSAFHRDYDESGVRCDDSSSHSPIWETSFPESTVPTALLAAQLDTDQEQELVVGTTASVVVALEGDSGWLKWQSPPIGTWIDLPILRAGDVLGGVAQEIVAASGDYYNDPVAILDSADGSLVGGPWDRSVTALDLAQLDGDPTLEIVCGTQSGSIAILDPTTGQLAAPLATFADQVDALRVADTTRDGVLDFVVVVGGVLQVWGGAESAVIWTGPYLGPEAGFRDSLWVGNFDTDSVPDIAVNTGYGFAIFEAPLFELFVDGFESGDTTAWTITLP